MVSWKLHRSILVLGPLYVCIVYMGFFAFLFIRDRPPKELFEEKSIKGEVIEAVTFSDINFNSTIHIPGNLNLHVWNDLCGLDVDRLRETPLFPHHPSERLLLGCLWQTQPRSAFSSFVLFFLFFFVFAFFFPCR